MEGRRFFPEQGKIQPPRGMQERGGSTFNVSAPTRHDGVIATPERPTTPTQPRPDTRQPAPEQRPVKPEKDHTGRNIVLGTTALGVLGLGAYEAYQNVPAIHQMVDQAFLSHLRGDRLVSTDITKPEAKFDNTATKGVVGPKKILYIPQEEFNRLPLADEEGNPIFDFPWDNNNPVKIKYEKSLWPPPDWWKSNVDPNTEIKNNFEGKVALPAGYEFTTPYPGRVFFGGTVYNEEASQKSPSNPYGLAVYGGPPVVASIKFIAPNGNLYGIGISFRNEKGSITLEPLIADTRIGLNEHGLRERDWEKGILVERGQKIFRVPQEGTFIMHMSIGGAKHGKYDSVEGRIPGNFQFQTGKDSAGVGKLLVPETK